ncbi:MAG: Fe-S cluster assembly ATPase SufC [Chlamydiota bacterium]
MLEIQNLCVEVNQKKIIRDLTLSLRQGEIHVVMGPNGVGKSTLSQVLAGHPAYRVTEGKILFKGKDLTTMSPEERSFGGLFVSFQHPMEIAGISNLQFLQAIYNAKRKKLNLPKMGEKEFLPILKEKMTLVGMKEEFIKRNMNEGFSGGEKKRNEVLQMALLDPMFCVLDELDSGLDIDALKTLAHAVNFLKRADMTYLLITHYSRILNYIKPDFVHVMMGGKIVKTGDLSLADELEKRGYDWLI